MADMPDFSVDVETDGPIQMLRLTGELVFDSAPVLRSLVADLGGQADVVIELSGVEFMDSTGLAALLYARRQAAAEGWTLTLRKPRPNVAALLKVTALDRIFTIEP
jgi:anti-sigma B factor antagonist